MEFIYIFSTTSPGGGLGGGWSDKTKVIPNSTQVEVKVEVGVELRKKENNDGNSHH